jgi:hypothetical protein
MKKLVVFIVLLLSTTIAFSLKPTLTPQQKFLNSIPSYLKAFELNLTFTFIDQDLTFEDLKSKNTSGILYQTSYLLNTIDFMFADLKMSLSDTNIMSITYSMFIINDKALDKNKEPNLRYDIFMDRGWLLAYFYAKQTERNNMLVDLFNKYFKQLSTGKQSKI